MIFLRYLLQTLLLSLFNPATALIINSKFIVTEDEFKSFSSCFPDGTLIDPYWLITSARRETHPIIKLHSISETCKVAYTVTFPKWNQLDHKIGLNDPDKLEDSYYDVKLIRLQKPVLNYKPIKRSRLAIQGEAIIISFINTNKNLLNDINKTKNLFKTTLEQLEETTKKSELHNYNGRLQQLGTTKISDLPSPQKPYRLFMNDLLTRYECKMDLKNSYDVGAPLMIKGSSPDDILLLGQLFGVNIHDSSCFSAVNYSEDINNWIDHVFLLDSFGGEEAVKSQYKEAVHPINRRTLTRNSSALNYSRNNSSRCRIQKEIIRFEDLFKHPNFLRFAIYESFLGFKDYPWHLDISFENLINKPIERCNLELQNFWKTHLNNFESGKGLQGILFLASDNALTILTKEAINAIVKDSKCRKQFLSDHLYENTDFSEEPSESSKNIILLKNSGLENLFALSKTSDPITLQPNLFDNEWNIQFNSLLSKQGQSKIIGKKQTVQKTLNVYEIDKPIISPNLVALLNDKHVFQIFKEDPIVEINSNDTIWNKLKENKDYSIFCDLLESTGLDKLLASQTTNGITALPLENNKMHDLLKIFNYETWNDMHSDDITFLMKYFILDSKIEKVHQEINTTTQTFNMNFFGTPKQIEEDYYEEVNIMNDCKHIKPLKRLIGFSDQGRDFYTLSNSPIHFQCLNQRFDSRDIRQTVTLKIREIYSSLEEKEGVPVAIKTEINCFNGIIYPLADSLIVSDSPTAKRFLNPMQIKH